MPDDLWNRHVPISASALPPCLSQVSPVEEIIAEARAGHMFVLMDDQDRENEGDLIIPAQFASPEVINFMARHCRGLVCLALTQQRVAELELPMMSSCNGAPFATNFTVSVEAREGVTTGISAHDRARTIATAISAESVPSDLVRPGHMFPLAAKRHGVLERPGHTEASVDIARLAGMIPAAAICEIMNDDGRMARGEDLVRFCQAHHLKLGTIADLVAYRERTETLVQRTAQSELYHDIGGYWMSHVFAEIVSSQEHFVLTKGPVSAGSMGLIRMHRSRAMEGLLPNSCGEDIAQSMHAISDAGQGVLILTRDSFQGALAQQVGGIDHGHGIGRLSRSALQRQILQGLGLQTRPV